MKRLILGNPNTAVAFANLSEKEYGPFDRYRWRLLLKKWRGDKLLDIGSYDSDLPGMAMAKYFGSDVRALDFDQRSLSRLKAKFPGIKIDLGDACNMPYDSDYFDYVVAGEVIEHLDLPWRFIQEAKRVLYPGGTLALSVPYKETGVGEVDGKYHIWGFDEDDIREFARYLGGKPKIKIIRRCWPKFWQYHHPIMIAWIRKEQPRRRK
jgi:SAM-dependent methyltransferase